MALPPDAPEPGRREAARDDGSAPRPPAADGEAPLTATEQQRLVSVMEAGLAVETPAALAAWTRGDFQQILPHRTACAFAEDASPKAMARHAVVSGSPGAGKGACPGGRHCRELVTRWQGTSLPQSAIAAPSAGSSADADAVPAGRLVHGLVGLGRQGGVAVALCRDDRPFEPREAYFLRLLLPHMHSALARSHGKAITLPCPPASLPLTAREQGILAWIGAGKTNWEIARVLGVTENTVRNHAKRIYAKLGVRNRAQAVSKAVRLGILPAGHS